MPRSVALCQGAVGDSADHALTTRTEVGSRLYRISKPATTGWIEVARRRRRACPMQTTWTLTAGNLDYLSRFSTLFTASFAASSVTSASPATCLPVREKSDLLDLSVPSGVSTS